MNKAEKDIYMKAFQASKASDYKARKAEAEKAVEAHRSAPKAAPPKKGKLQGLAEARVKTIEEAIEGGIKDGSR